MPAAAHGHVDVHRPCQLHGVGDVGDAAAARDQNRSFVHEPVVNAAGVVIGGVGRLQELSGE